MHLQQNALNGDRECGGTLVWNSDNLLTWKKIMPKMSIRRLLAHVYRIANMKIAIGKILSNNNNNMARMY